MKNKVKISIYAAVAGFFYLSAPAQATPVKVEITNQFAAGGLALTPFWVGFQDGSFDTFDVGSAASSQVQAVAEGGNTAPITGLFSAGASNGVQGTITAPAGFAGAPVFEPGETASAIFNINATDSGYLSFLSMLIPTNDAFIGNDDPMAYSLFDNLGNFTALDIIIYGTQVYDSGTEENLGDGSPFLPGSGAGTAENGLIALHPGLDLEGGFSIFGALTPAGYTVLEAAADFTASQLFEVARIRVTQVSEPAMVGIMGLGILGMISMARRRKALMLKT
ncbi:MAG: spondin domain-containing protein [Emcibacter sp.]|nr:spondin domain-containing protein [Emcibacter sp.]